MYGDEPVHEGTVCVVSAVPPIPDGNLPARDGKRGAGYFVGGVPPLRLAITDANYGTDRAYSFTLPMTPRTEEGAGRLLEELQCGSEGQGEAGERVASTVRERYPFAFPGSGQ